LDFDERLGALGAGGHAGQVAAQGFELAVVVARVGRLGHGAARLGRERLELAALAGGAPLGQVRGVQALAPQERAERAGLGARVGQAHDAALVFGAERAPLGLGLDFGRGHLGPAVERHRRGASTARPAL